MNCNVVNAVASIHTIEMSCVLGQYAYDTLVEYALENCSCEVKKNGRSKVKSLIDDGIRVALRPTPYGGTVYVVLNPQKILDPKYIASDIVNPTDKNMSAVRGRAEKLLKGIGLPHNLGKYLVEEVDLCGQIFDRTNSCAREYERLAGKSLIPADGERIPFFDARRGERENKKCDKDWFKLEFHDRALVVYDKKNQSMREQLRGCKEVPRGTTRIEVQLHRKALRKHEEKNGLAGWNLVCWLAQHSADLLTDELSRFFFRGVYLKRDELEEVITASDFKNSIRDRMLLYVKLAKKHGETKAAQKLIGKENWSRSEFIRFRRRFEKLGIQPTPLRTNYHDSWLEPPQDCIYRNCQLGRNRDSEGFYRLWRRAYVPQEG